MTFGFIRELKRSVPHPKLGSWLGESFPCSFSQVHKQDEILLLWCPQEVSVPASAAVCELRVPLPALPTKASGACLALGAPEVPGGCRLVAAAERNWFSQREKITSFSMAGCLSVSCAEPHSCSDGNRVSFPAQPLFLFFSEPVCGNSPHVPELGGELQTARVFRALTKQISLLIYLYITSRECLSC